MREPPKPLRRHAGLFETIDWLADFAQWTIEAILNLQHGQEQTTHMAEDLQASLDANQAATDAAVAAISTEIAQLQAAIDALSTATPPTQAQIDQLNASTAKLTAATTALGADDPAPTP